MPTNREAYFEAIKLGVPKTVVDFALCETNGFDYLELTKHFDEDIKNYSLLKESIDRYINGEMIEYIFNKAYFLGKPFYVDKNVLIPRQETEQLVLETKKLIEQMFYGKLDIADVCCGSGAIGLSLNRLLEGHKFYLSDISKEAIRVSKKNARGAQNVSFLEGDMLKPFIEQGIKLDVIVCNPPYIDKVDQIDEQVFKYEPHLALLANPSTKFYEEIFAKANKVMNEHYLMAFEIDEDMEQPLIKLMNKYLEGANYRFHKDIYNKMRFLYIIK